MKKLAIVSGYLAMILIALYAVFAVRHIPGANILVSIGCVLFCLVFAPLWSWLRYKEAGSTLNKAISVVAFLTMFFLGVSVIAKALFWGCGIINACIGSTFLILLILLVIIQAFKEGDPWKALTLHTVAIVSGIVLTLVTLLQLTTISKCTLYEFTEVINTQNKEIKYFEGKSNGFFENFDKNAANAAAVGYYEKAQQVNAQCDSMVAILKAVGEEMMSAADKKAVPFDSVQNLCHPGYSKACNESCSKFHNDSTMGIKYEQFRVFMNENTNSRGKELLEMFFPAMPKDTAQGCSSDGGQCCEGCCGTMISQIIGLNANILHIRMLQAESMNYLQTMQAKSLFQAVKSEE
jgi:hypothetical protein